MRRVFLGWQRPVLHGASEWLLNELGTDLGELLVAVPGARAAVRLRELLAERAPPDWTPPRVLTQGALIDELVQLEQPAAGRLTRTLVWERALASLTDEERGRLARARGGEGEILRLAETVRALHGELTPEGRDFADLASASWGAALAPEELRWKALGKAQERYRALLGRLGLVDPHEGRSRAITQGALELTRRIVLVGVADMNHLLVRLLEAVAERVTALVAAPADLADGFDGLGRLRTEFWRERDVPLELGAWRVSEKPVDQAEMLRTVLEEWHGEFAPAELTVGVADESVVPYLERALVDCGVVARRAAGTALERTRPMRLLRALVRYLARRGFAELAALARDPDLGAALGRDDDLVARFDRYQREHLPRRARDWIGQHPFEQAVADFHRRLERSLGALAGGERRPLAAWAEPIRAWLTLVFAGELVVEHEPDRVLAEALGSIGAALAELEQVPASLDLAAFGAHEALELLLRALRNQRIPPAEAPPDNTSVDLVGWLDLPLDDAPALVLTGFNDGKIPQALGAHPFLPDGRRRQLGLPGDVERLARDVYAATVILETRQRRVFVSARRSAEGDPLVPSRLAFHCPEAEVLARVQRFLPAKDEVHGRIGAEDASTNHACPLLPGWRAPERLSVSSFRTFLSSPYEFYLRHVLEVDTLDDRVQELDPRRFGILAHAVLQDLGQTDVGASPDPAEVAAFLLAALRRHAANDFGPTPLPAVELQLEQLAHRLRAFAQHQARRAAEGWRIHAVEWKPAPFALEVDGSTQLVSGKIDRVDRHPDGRWAILDYKTGEGQKRPRDAHMKKGEWLDLQLPLYRQLGAALGLAGEPELGYAWIGKDDESTGFFIDPWTATELEDALEEARRIVRAVRAGDFRTPGRPPYDEILRAIFGQSTLGEESPP